MLYYGDQGDIENYANSPGRTEEILRVEAFNVLDYHIPNFALH